MPCLKRLVAVRPILVAVAFPVNKAAVVDWRTRRRAGNGLGGRHWLRLAGRGALPVLKCMVAINPVLIVVALPIYKTAVVHICRRAGYRLTLAGRGALPVLIGVPAVDPVLIAMALPIYVAAVVNWRSRLLLRRWRRAAFCDAAVIDPIGQPDFASAPVDLQPAIELADHLKNSARSNCVSNVGGQTGRGSQVKAGTLARMEYSCAVCYGAKDKAGERLPQCTSFSFTTPSKDKAEDGESISRHNLYCELEVSRSTLRAAGMQGLSAEIARQNARICLRLLPSLTLRGGAGGGVGTANRSSGRLTGNAI